MWRKHIVIWLAIIFLTLLLVPLISSPQAQWRNVKTELGMISAAMGMADARRIAETATGIYNAIFIDSGLIPTIEAAHVSEKQINDAHQVMGRTAQIADVTNNYVLTVGALVYTLLVRLRIFLEWLPFTVPFILAAGVDGYSRRLIKFAEFGEYGSTVFAGAMHLSVILLATPLLYLLSPIPVSPFFVPFWGIVYAIPVTIMVSNANQILPR